MTRISYSSAVVKVGTTCPATPRARRAITLAGQRGHKALVHYDQLYLAD